MTAFQQVSKPGRAAPVLLWAAAVAAAIALGWYAQPVIPGMGLGGRLLPRIAPMPTDARTLLFQLGVGSTFWYVSIALLPLIVAGARRLDPGTRRLRHGAVVLAALTVLIVVTSTIDYVVTYSGIDFRPPLAAALIAGARRNALPWIALVGLVLAVESRRRAHRSIVERERLRAEVAEQRVIALTSQLQPHFLFNTLQGISTLIHRDPAGADEMLGKLSDLLRDLLRHRDCVTVSLWEELQFARTYLEIAKIRFGDRLRFAINVDAALLEVSVPLFLLQPLVENALKHGIGARISGGSITITASRDRGRIRLAVENDGPSMEQPPGEGVGLSNTRERLQAAFGAKQSFTLLPRSAGGAVAVIDMPVLPAGMQP